MLSLPVSSRSADHRRRRTVQKPHCTEGRELGQHLAMQADVHATTGQRGLIV